jgi:hypothetical protein
MGKCRDKLDITQSLSAFKDKTPVKKKFCYKIKIEIIYLFFLYENKLHFVLLYCKKTSPSL